MFFFYYYYLSSVLFIATTGIVTENSPLYVDVHLSYTFLPKVMMKIVHNEIESSDVLYNISVTQGDFDLHISHLQ